MKCAFTGLAAAVVLGHASASAHHQHQAFHAHRQVSQISDGQIQATGAATYSSVAPVYSSTTAAPVYSSAPPAPVYSISVFNSSESVCVPTTSTSVGPYSLSTLPAPVYSSATAAPVYSSVPSAPVYSSATVAPVYSTPVFYSSASVCVPTTSTSVGPYSLSTAPAPVYTSTTPVSVAPVYTTTTPVSVAPVYTTTTPVSVAPVYTTTTPVSVAPVYTTTTPVSVAPVYSTVSVVPIYSLTSVASPSTCQVYTHTYTGSFTLSPYTASPTPVYTSSSSSSSSSAPPAPVYTSSSSAPPAPVYSSSVAAAAVYTTSAAPVPVYSHASAPSPPSSGGAAPISPNGSLWAMAYNPYADNGGCKSSSDIYSDMATIASKGFTSIRVYSTDCGTFSAVAPACKQNGLNMILGVFISDTGIGAAAEQVSEIISFGQWSMVEMIVVGNEAIFNGYCSASELAGFIASSKAQFKAAGFTGPVTTTEPPGTLESSASSLCGVVDVLASNIHAFFDSSCPAANAGEYVAGQLDTLSKICGNTMDMYNLETGWPTAGDSDGMAIPGYAEQAIALDAIRATAGAKSTFFSYENNMWQSPGAYGNQQFWGCIDVF